MVVGGLDLLSVLSKDEVEEYGIPYVRSVIEEDLSEEKLDKWEQFWVYFDKEWTPKLDLWNICDDNGKARELNNRTNNGLERYNRKVNGFFPKKPTLTSVNTLSLP